MSAPRGPGAPFELLFDDDASPPSSQASSLPEPFRTIYGGDWRPPRPAGRPYVYANFALSRDGRISFAEPGHLGGGDVSGFEAHDQWLMGLLRARADAVVVGDGTLRLEPEHLWTSAFIFPADAEAFSGLRVAEGRAPAPLQVFLSQGGDLPEDAAVLRDPGARVVVATGARGAERAAGLRCAGSLEVLELGEESVDPARLLAALHTDFGVRTLLCEGGPRAYGALLAAGAVDDEFLTLCPVVVGGGADGRRPGLVEGVGFHPRRAPRSLPVSLRRAGAHLYLRSRLQHPEGGAAP